MGKKSNIERKKDAAATTLIVGVVCGAATALIGFAMWIPYYDRVNWGLTGFGVVVVLLSFIAWGVMSPKEDEASETIPNENAPSVADELSKLATLKDNGVLSEEEFQTLKAKILNQ